MSELADVFREPARNADPAAVDQELDTATSALDALGKDLDNAIERYNRADEAWLVLYDRIAETLREDYREAGRKSDPAEHVIVSETRRQHRSDYTEWKRAKRDLERVEKQMQALGRIVGARQTQAAGLREELRAGAFSR